MPLLPTRHAYFHSVAATVQLESFWAYPESPDSLDIRLPSTIYQLPAFLKFRSPRCRTSRRIEEDKERQRRPAQSRIMSTPRICTRPVPGCQANTGPDASKRLPCPEYDADPSSPTIPEKCKA